jgi:hypothetical protein
MKTRLACLWACSLALLALGASPVCPAEAPALPEPYGSSYEVQSTVPVFGGDSYDGEVEYPGYLGDEDGQLDPRKHDPE